jgi:formate/nitrite transporter FocA (FNT family)
MKLFIGGIVVGILISITVWAVYEVKSVEHWNKP